ncbi:cyclin-dependent protein kinase [Xylographa bjoerkii]|nr:cyclin-dependent protein kinase [Xylographa bjoerkii]
MSGTNPPSSAGGPQSAAASVRATQNLKRSVQAAFDEPADPKKMPSPGYTSKVRVHEKYKVVGFISSGTYGRVYKAVGRNGQPGDFAIKKFKPDKEGEVIQYTGISQSACREMALCSELNHPNVINLIEIILEDKCIFMVFEYAEHDLLQIIHHHTQPPRHPIPASTIKSVLFQLLNGLLYLHTNWVLHRDLKPANIMVTSRGEVRIGDLGLARLFYKPLHSLFSGDKVVVTIWYRAPELLLGSRHYTPAVDLWAVGCIFAELLSLRPIFKGEEAKMDSKKTVPFQRNQMQKIVEILGMPTKEKWPGLVHQPEHGQLQTLSYASREAANSKSSGLEPWYYSTLKSAGYSESVPCGDPGALGYDLLAKLLEYDPERRLTAKDALQHPYFYGSGEKVSANCFEGLTTAYPHRRVSQDDNDVRMSSLPGTKKNGLPDDTYGRPTKRMKEG